MKYLPFLILIVTISIQNHTKPLLEQNILSAPLVQSVFAWLLNQTIMIPQVADGEAFGK